MNTPHRSRAEQRRHLTAMIERLDSALLDADPADADQLGQARYELARQLAALDPHSDGT